MVARSRIVLTHARPLARLQYVRLLHLRQLTCYVSQLTLNCVFVVDKGRFTGMINKGDIVRGGF